MNIYKKLPIEIQENIDEYVIKNNKYCNKKIFKNLEYFHKNKLIFLIFDHYNQFNIQYSLSLSERFANSVINSNLIETDLLYWLNDPYSRNMENPIMGNYITQKFISVMKRLFPHSPSIVSYEHYNFATEHLEKKEIVNKILNKLNIKELEEFYIYRCNEIGILNSSNIISITHGNKAQGYW